MHDATASERLRGFFARVRGWAMPTTTTCGCARHGCIYICICIDVAVTVGADGGGWTTTTRGRDGTRAEGWRGGVVSFLDDDDALLLLLLLCVILLLLLPLFVDEKVSMDGRCTKTDGDARGRFVSW